MQPGDKVRVRANPGRIGILGNKAEGPEARQRVLVNFLDGDVQFILQASLEKVETESLGPHTMISAGRYGRVGDLRGVVTYYRLSGKLANLIYSLNTTNTQFLAYQFKPVLHFLESPCRGILIADEVGLGKTIEAGLIWTELRARLDARRLLVICPAMLREKWQMELSNRFGVQAEIVDAQNLLKKLRAVPDRRQDGFALIASMQGLRPPRDWQEGEKLSASGKLARFLDEAEVEESLLDLVVIDEAHYMRNRETQTYRLGQLVRSVAENLVLLSATPIQLRNTDLFHLLNLLDADAFPYENSFAETLSANAPIIALRDQILSSNVSQQEFVEALKGALAERIFDDNAQIEYLIGNAPDDETLRTPRGRSEIAERLDKINPLAKVVTRTRKRDVQEVQVVRDARAIKATMRPEEEAFYWAVTEKVRAFCQDLAISTGFMLTIPQRQMSSCMAAACRGWAAKLDKAGFTDIDESAFEIFGGSENDPGRPPQLGTLLTELVKVARSVGDFQVLKANDSKYAKLIKSLCGYWNENPGKKVVLFSFYRHTLNYLKERLAEDRIKSVLVYGGMDKQAALAEFADTSGPDILLSSEVASEGVDLQFSSLLINYDLPWNPMRIEQRIGRIDRIGQEAKRILIWNFMYADTIDDRVYERLLERLDIFKRALGSIEAILGEEIRELGYELLRHSLTPTEEQELIDRSQVVIETLNRSQDALEDQATQLIAHGDYIQNKVHAARELGRYVAGADLYVYVRDYLDRSLPGSQLIQANRAPMMFSLELSVEGRVRLERFLGEHRLGDQTSILSTSPALLHFENKLGAKQRGIERVTQDHPLIRFVSEQLRVAGSGPGYCNVSAIELPANATGIVPPGLYVYAIARWTLSGSRDLERLEYAAIGVEHGKVIEGEDAERLVNFAAMEGKDWLGAANNVNNQMTADLFETCLARMDGAFLTFRDSYKREDLDRINLMVNTLEHHRKAQQKKIAERIQFYRDFGNERQRKMIPAQEGKRKKQDTSLLEKIEALRLREKLSASDSFVSGGIIRVL